MLLDFTNFEPCLLIAAPELQDPNFAQRIVFLIEYQQDSGAFGLTVNYPLDMPLGDVIESHSNIIPEYTKWPLWLGGPVSTDTVFCLYQYDGNPRPGDQAITDEIAIATAQSLCQQEPPAPPIPDSAKIFAGHAGWSAEQLEQEIQEGAWLLAKADTATILCGPEDDVWAQHTSALGIREDTYHSPESDLAH